MMTSLRGENGSLRGLTGSGEPGLYTLLGGTAVEQDSSQLTLMGGPGQTSAASRLAQVYKDVRVGAVAAGRQIPSEGQIGGGGPGTPGGGQRPPTQAK